MSQTEYLCSCQFSMIRSGSRARARLRNTRVSRTSITSVDAGERGNLATVVVEAGGMLRLQGQSYVITFDTVAGNEILSNIVEAASVGDVVPLPITQRMAVAWLAARQVRCHEAVEDMSRSSRQLARTLMVRAP